MIPLISKSSIAGEFRIKVWSLARGVKQDVKFNNLIVDQGLNYLGGQNCFNYFLVGTGTSVPTNNQTQLDAFRAAIAIVQDYQTTFVDGSEPYCYAKYTARFQPGAASGILAEIGMGKGNASTNQQLFSRALIVDNNGDPTTITVLADEYLDVEYILKVYPSLVDTTGSVVISGKTYNWTARAASIGGLGPEIAWSCSFLSTDGFAFANGGRVYCYSGNIGTVYQAPSGIYAQFDGQMSNPGYQNNSYTSQGTMQASLSAANVAGGIRSLWVRNHSRGIPTFQIQLSDVIVKDNTKSLSMSFSHQWARK